MAKQQRYPQLVKPDGSIKLRHQLKARNTSQGLYLDSLRNSTITFCNGPAGTGKTYLVTGVAIEKLIAGEVERIVITRPIVEAGEKLGSLPGTLEDKVHPYLLPILDCIEDHVGPTMAKKLMDSGKIEIAPLAYLRGRSLNNVFAILDEAQNTTKEQLKMFLTRIGYGSIFVVDGDASQNDLPRNVESGLAWAVDRLKGVNENINVIEFSQKDIVRHPLISVMLTHLDGPGITPISGNLNGHRPRREITHQPGALLSSAGEIVVSA